MHGAVINMEPFKTINDHTYTIFSGSACPRWLDRHNIKHHGHVNTARDTVRCPHTLLIRACWPYQSRSAS